MANLDWLNAVPGFASSSAVQAANALPHAGEGTPPDPIAYVTTRPVDYNPRTDAGNHFTNSRGQRVYPVLSDAWLDWAGYIPDPTKPISNPNSLSGLVRIPELPQAIAQARAELGALDPSWLSASDQAIVDKVKGDSTIFKEPNNALRRALERAAATGHSNVPLNKPAVPVAPRISLPRPPGPPKPVVPAVKPVGNGAVVTPGTGSAPQVGAPGDPGNYGGEPGEIGPLGYDPFDIEARIRDFADRGIAGMKLPGGTDDNYFYVDTFGNLIHHTPDGTVDGTIIPGSEDNFAGLQGVGRHHAYTGLDALQTAQNLAALGELPQDWVQALTDAVLAGDAQPADVPSFPDETVSVEDQYNFEAPSAPVEDDTPSFEGSQEGSEEAAEE